MDGFAVTKPLLTPRRRDPFSMEDLLDFADKRELAL
jgi:hypothetical protein